MFLKTDTTQLPGIRSRNKYTILAEVFTSYNQNIVRFLRQMQLVALQYAACNTLITFVCYKAFLV